jgi:hypothetical protein
MLNLRGGGGRSGGGRPQRVSAKGVLRLASHLDDELDKSILCGSVRKELHITEVCGHTLDEHLRHNR